MTPDEKPRQCSGECEHPDNVRSCGAISPRGYLICTRIKGHHGRHEACGTTTHPLETWANDEALRRGEKKL